MKAWEKGILKVSDNGRYLQNGESPFFWLGDTAWLIFEQCSLEESYIYLKNRRDKGYNVIQATLVQRIPESREEQPAGMVRSIWTPGFWEHCEKVVAMAEDLGLYMALLPTWGGAVKSGKLNEENVAQYADFLVERFGKFPNLIWLLGGDVRGDAGLSVYPKFGKCLKERLPEVLLGFHPFGRTSSSLWFHGESWLDFDMFQSGHRRYDQRRLSEWDDNNLHEEYFGEDNWRYVNRDHALLPIKPTIDGEPSYEGIPHGLHNPAEPYWDAPAVRRYAYWSVFQGAMGHTYGSNAIMQFHTANCGKGSFGVREDWKTAMHHEGAGHMKHLADLMNSVDFRSGAPAEQLLLSGQKEKYQRISVFAGSDFVFCYDYTGDGFTLNLAECGLEKRLAYWFDPTSGVYSFLGDLSTETTATFRPVPRTGGNNDCVLVIKAN